MVLWRNTYSHAHYENEHTEEYAHLRQNMFRRLFSFFGFYHSRITIRLSPDVWQECRTVHYMMLYVFGQNP